MTYENPKGDSCEETTVRLKSRLFSTLDKDFCLQSEHLLEAIGSRRPALLPSRTKASWRSCRASKSCDGREESVHPHASKDADVSFDREVGMLVEFSSSDVRLASCSSCVVSANIDLCWEQLRDFGKCSSWMKQVVMAGQPVPVASYMVGGTSGSTVGAVRVIEFGPHRLLEQLDALDDDKHVLKFHIVSHPSNINPFPGSYVNSRTKMSCQPISMGDQTRYGIDTEYRTDVESLDAMQHVFQMFQETICQNLQQWAVNWDTHSSGGSRLSGDQRPQHAIGQTNGSPHFPGHNRPWQQHQQQQHQQWLQQQRMAADGHAQYFQQQQQQQQQQQELPSLNVKAQPSGDSSSGESQSSMKVASMLD